MAIHSDWGDWLPRAVAAADPDGLACWYLGCNGFVLKSSSGTTVLIDPYLGTGDPPRTVRMVPVPFEPTDLESVDAVLATHEHTDHVHGPSQGPILAETGAEYYAPAASIGVVREEGWPDSYGFAPGLLERVEPGRAVRIGDLTVRVQPADDPDAEEPVAYLIEHQSGTFFHAGDARPGGFGDVGDRYDIDLGAVAFGSTGTIPDKETGKPERTTWYNDETDAVRVATELRLDRLLPTHWDMWKGLTADPTALHHHARSFDHPRSLEVVEIGDRVDLR